jgi:hypothetical protein
VKAGAVLVLLLAGSGCAGRADVLPGPGGLCDAAKARPLIGKSRAPAVESQALKLSGARRVRWIPEGAAVTMDFSPDRLNLYLDRKGRIARVRCG